MCITFIESFNWKTILRLGCMYNQKNLKSFIKENVIYLTNNITQLFFPLSKIYLQNKWQAFMCTTNFAVGDIKRRKVLDFYYNVSTLCSIPRGKIIFIL